MFDEVKKIKLEELNDQKKHYEEQEETVKEKLNAIRSELNKIKFEFGGCENDQEYRMTIIENFSFLEKWVTRRREYKEFKAQSKRLSELQKSISKLTSEFNEENVSVEHELEELGISANLRKIRQKIDFVENASTLYEIGITTTDAIKLLENNGIPPVLNESDRCVFSHPRDYSSKSSLIGVHKTMYAPTSNMIKSAKDSNVEFTTTITINGVEYKCSYKSMRDTVHMAMNNEVSSHTFGSWEDCKYAVLIPFDDIPNEKIGRAAPMDTFTRGSIELSERTWILCPQSEVERLKTFNPKVHVLGYEGESVKEFSGPFLTQLGYREEDIGMWSWIDKESDSQFNQLMRREGIRNTPHSYSYFSQDEKCLAGINLAVSLCKVIRDNHLITTPEDIPNMVNELTSPHYSSFRGVLRDLMYKSCLGKSEIEPQSIMGNNKQVDFFIDEMKNNGFHIPLSYQGIMKKLMMCNYSKNNIENKDAMFSVSEETSERERKTIEELQSYLFSDHRLDYDPSEDAFNKFISTVICESILDSRDREISTEKIQYEK